MTKIARYFIWLRNQKARAERVKDPLRHKTTGPVETQENVWWISEHATWNTKPQS